MSDFERFEFTEWKPIERISDDFALSVSEAARRLKNTETGTRRQTKTIIEFREQYIITGKIFPISEFAGVWFLSDDGTEIFVKNEPFIDGSSFNMFIFSVLFSTAAVYVISRL